MNKKWLWATVSLACLLVCLFMMMATQNDDLGVYIGWCVCEINCFVWFTEMMKKL